MATTTTTTTTSDAAAAGSYRTVAELDALELGCHLPSLQAAALMASGDATKKGLAVVQVLPVEGGGTDFIATDPAGQEALMASVKNEVGNSAAPAKRRRRRKAKVATPSEGATD